MCLFELIFGQNYWKAIARAKTKKKKKKKKKKRRGNSSMCVSVLISYEYIISVSFSMCLYSFKDICCFFALIYNLCNSATVAARSCLGNSYTTVCPPV